MSQNTTEPLRNHKDTVFRMLFSEKENAIELFNALEGTDYGPDTEVEFTTLDDAVYAGLKNDLGFIIGSRFIVLTEHQSSINNNMALRQLEYIARTYEKLVDSASLFSSRRVKIPAPEFFVIYTGREEWKAKTLRLSDSFLAEPSENSLELVVKIINVRYNTDKDDEIQEILARSEKLRGYSLLLAYISEGREQGLDVKDAVDGAVRRCVREGVLKEFLEKNSPEVGSMLFKEITNEEFAEIRAKEAAEIAYDKGRNDGHKKGERLGFITACQELGLTDEQIAEKLADKYDMDEAAALEYIEKQLV